MSVILLGRPIADVARNSMFGVLLIVGTNCAAAPVLEPGPVVESEAITQKPGVGTSRFPVSVHVILQIHEQPIAERRATQDLGRVNACQESVVATAIGLAERGIPTVVVEGLISSGTFDRPNSAVVAEATRIDRIDAKSILANKKDLIVYGFESRALNEFAVGTANQLGKSSRRAVNIAKDAKGGIGTDAIEEINKLVQEEVTRVNLWWAGIVPARSFIALQTTLAIALARGINQIQLVIGKEHWKDLIYAANRNDSVRLRLIPYECR